MIGRPEGLPSRYRELRPLGSGGMGEVWRAVDLRSGKERAIKFLHVAEGKGERYQRFLREIDVLSKLRDPRVVAVHESGMAGGRPYFVMDLVRGSPLSELLAEGPLEAAKGHAVAREIADALAVVHEGGFCHRDLKPANVVIDGEDRPHLIDFGLVGFSDELARTALTRTGAALGSLAYMPPEILRGERGNARSDVFQLALLVLMIFTGANPLRDVPWPARAMGRHGDEVFVLPAGVDGDGRLGELLRRAMAADPKTRPTARELASFLRAWTPGEAPAQEDEVTEEIPSDLHVPVSPVPASDGAASSSSGKRTPAVLLGGGILLVLALFLVLGRGSGEGEGEGGGSTAQGAFRWRRPALLDLERMAVRFEGSVPAAVRVRFFLPETGEPAPQKERRLTFGTVESESVRVRRMVCPLDPPPNGALRVELDVDGREPARFLIDPGAMLEERLGPIDRFVDRCARLDLFSLCSSIQGSMAIRHISGAHLIDPTRRLVSFLADQGVEPGEIAAFRTHLDWYLQGRARPGSLRARRLLPLRRLEAVTSDRGGRLVPWGTLEDRIGFEFHALPLRARRTEGRDIRPITDWDWVDHAGWVDACLREGGWKSIGAIDCIDRRSVDGEERPLWVWVVPEASRREWTEEAVARVVESFQATTGRDYQERRPALEDFHTRWQGQIAPLRPPAFDEGELRLDLLVRHRPFLEGLVAVNGGEPIHFFAVAPDHAGAEGLRPYDPFVLSVPIRPAVLGEAEQMGVGITVLRLPAAVVSETLGLGAVGLRWRRR